MTASRVNDDNDDDDGDDDDNKLPLEITLGDPLSSHTDVSFTPSLAYTSSSNSSSTSPLMLTIVMWASTHLPTSLCHSMTSSSSTHFNSLFSFRVEGVPALPPPLSIAGDALRGANDAAGDEDDGDDDDRVVFAVVVVATADVEDCNGSAIFSCFVVDVAVIVVLLLLEDGEFLLTAPPPPPPPRCRARKEAKTAAAEKGSARSRAWRVYCTE
mmetsp:Transcript_39604/g.64457  ORF Transcript_39604/g.64457 Transcript_39604/m.64457 type:complete len:213 (-) Transcript_39604:571-1209(-)